MPDNTPVCRRCGRCCELGGPGLLRDDAPLLSSGALKPEMLVCLRRGQWARQDGMGGGLAQLENEMIKLAGTGKAPHPWQCLAYAPGTGCTIYDRRPVQCGVLFCEDTRPLEALLRDVPALDRRAAIALLPLPDAQRRLWEELVQAHEEACDVRQYFALLDMGDREAAAAMERYDAAFRQLCVERTALFAGTPPARSAPQRGLAPGCGLRAAGCSCLSSDFLRRACPATTRPQSASPVDRTAERPYL